MNDDIVPIQLLQDGVTKGGAVFRIGTEVGPEREMCASKIPS